MALWALKSETTVQLQINGAGNQSKLSSMSKSKICILVLKFLINKLLWKHLKFFKSAETKDSALSTTLSYFKTNTLDKAWNEITSVTHWNATMHSQSCSEVSYSTKPHWKGENLDKLNMFCEISVSYWPEFVKSYISFIISIQSARISLKDVNMDK